MRNLIGQTVPKFNGTIIHQEELDFIFSNEMTSKRIQNFRHIGTNCVSCPRKGTYLVLRELKYSRGSSFHWNILAEDLIPITIDHIIPKSKGGPNTVSNYQPMCTICNCEKGNKLS